MTEHTSAWGDWDASTRDDPYPRFESMRARCPVHQVRLADGHDAWLVLGHNAAREALKDSRLSKDMVAALDRDPGIADAGLPGPAFARHMLNVDPPDHTRLRRLVSRAFAPTRIAELEPSIERIANELLDELSGGGPRGVVDLVAGFARPLPFRVISELLGVPEEERDVLYQSFRTLFQPWTGSPPPGAVAASDAIVASLARLVESHRVHPRDDLVGVLVAASDDGDRLTEQELQSSLFQLIVAGHDTTTSLIGNGVVALLDHPDQMRLLCDDVGRLPAAVEELIRFSAPVPHATFRVTTEPVCVEGVRIPAHEQVLICLGAADRDPEFFDDPTALDINRDSHAHLGFGHGIHFCLGAPLARLEARVAFGALLGRFPDLCLAVDRSALHWTHGDGLVLRGLDQLPVRLGASPPTKHNNDRSITHDRIHDPRLRSNA